MDSRTEQEIRRLAEKNHSFYLYDLNTVRAQIEKLSALPKNVEVFYAMKANDDDSILRLMLSSPRIKGIEVASAGEHKEEPKSEAQKVVAHESNLAKAIYTGPSKTLEELNHVLINGIKLVNLESLTEAYRVQALARRTQPVLLRLNTDHEIHGAATKMSFANEPTPFGIHESKAAQVIDEISRLDKLDLQGLHLFAATGVLDAQALLKHVDYSFNLFREIQRKTGRRFSILDFGGGIGIDYEGIGEFDIKGFSEGLQELIGEHRMQDKRLIFELGRYLVADSGHFVTTINDIKESRGKKILLCTSGTNAHRRPYALKINYPITILNRGENIIYPNQLKAENENVQVRGPLCTSADVLSQGTFVERAEIGDLVVMPKSGAYGADMSHKDFLGHEHVPEYTIGEKTE